MIESMSGPDPLRAKYREQLNEAIRRIVYEGMELATALAVAPVGEADFAAFEELVNTELDHLEPYNCARYRLPMKGTQAWIDRGRPR